jgi:hypothetical protein
MAGDVGLRINPDPFQDVSEIAPALSGIGHPSLLILEFCEGWCLAQPNFLPNFGSERRDALVGTNGKEKVIAALHHPHQHLLYQAVVRIDQHVVSLEVVVSRRLESSSAIFKVPTRIACNWRSRRWISPFGSPFLSGNGAKPVRIRQKDRNIKFRYIS